MKKAIMLLCLLMMLAPMATLAHTTLSSSNPTAGQVVTEQLEQLELTFATEIEEGSSMVLQGPSGTVELTEVSIAGNVMLGTLINELADGQYTISWKIIGADGHPIEGEVPFSIEMATVEAEPEAEESAEEAIEEPEAEEPEAEETADMATSAADNETEGGFLTIGLVILLVVLAGAMVLLLVKKKR